MSGVTNATIAMLADEVRQVNRRIAVIQTHLEQLIASDDRFCDQEDECPTCGNRLKNELVWLDDDHIMCMVCGGDHRIQHEPVACPDCGAVDVVSPPQEAFADMGMSEKAGTVYCQDCGVEFRPEEV